jgi:hypothetical protein
MGNERQKNKENPISDLLNEREQVHRELHSELASLRGAKAKVDHHQPIIGPPRSRTPLEISRQSITLPPASVNSNSEPWQIQHSEVPPTMAQFYRKLRAAGSTAPAAGHIAPASWSPPPAAQWAPFNPFESLSKQEEQQEAAAAAPTPPSVSDHRAAMPASAMIPRIPSPHAPPPPIPHAKFLPTPACLSCPDPLLAPIVKLASDVRTNPSFPPAREFLPSPYRRVPSPVPEHGA